MKPAAPLALFLLPVLLAAAVLPWTAGCKKSARTDITVRTIPLRVFSGINTNSVFIRWYPGPKDGYTNFVLYCFNSNTGAMDAVARTTNTGFRHEGLLPGTTNFYQLSGESAGGAGSSAFVFGYTAGGMYMEAKKELTVITINMHTYQETGQDKKFDIIAEAIATEGADFVALQECAQQKDSSIVGGRIRSDNMAYILCSRLKEYFNLDYAFAWDWSHYGFSVYEEGVAVLSRHGMGDSSSRTISSTDSTGMLTSRRAIYAGCDVPGFGWVNLFSAHLHWSDKNSPGEQELQVTNLLSFAAEMDKKYKGAVTIVCGDYNANPGSTAVRTMTAGGFIDTLAAADTNINRKFPNRIDYIFLKGNIRCAPLDSEIIFTTKKYGLVSDHPGIVTKFKLR